MMHHTRQAASRKAPSVPRFFEELRTSTRPDGRYLAVTSIEHGSDVVTIVSGRTSIDIPSDSDSISVSFLTKVYGGPLDGKTWLGNSSRSALANHVIAVTETTNAATPEHKSSDVAAHNG
jgi:hypothetical protein